MNPEQFLAHFDRLSEAPDAIPRMRRLILDLAVRGKLVEQDQKDESASELFKRMQEEKAKLIRENKVRIPRMMDVKENGDKPFPVPQQWIWCRLADVGAIVGGGTPPSADSDNFTKGGSGIAWLTPADLGKNQSLFVSHGERDLTPKGLRCSSATLMPKGSVLFTSRAPIGYTAIAENELSTNQGFKSVVPYIMESNHYIAVYFRAFGKQIDEKAPGTTFREVSGKIVSSLHFPLPPLAEQQRIVAKVDELMTLCDQLEAAKTKRESRRDSLVSASLQRLNNGSDAQSLREYGRFYLKNLPRLTTRAVHVQKLRQTILNLAVRGQLIPQDPNDEPASELLERIQMEKTRLSKRGKKNPKKPLPDPTEANLPFVLPESWAWTHLDYLSEKITDGEHLSPNKTSSGMPLLTATHVTEKGVMLNNPQFVSIEDGLRFRQRCDPRRGDILICSRGTIGRCAVVNTDETFCLMGSVILVRITKQCLPAYINYFLSTDRTQKQMGGMSGATAVNALYLKDIRFCPIAVPPLAEQHRIVAKVDQLMKLCDELESKLLKIWARSEKYTESVVQSIIR